MRAFKTFCAVLMILFLAGQAQALDINQLRHAAKQGDAMAQLNLGAAYDNGLEGLRPNPRRAVHWYTQAAEQGLAKAQFNLAHCLATGSGVGQNYESSRYWMEKAANQGIVDAQFLYGMMLAEGLGGPVEEDKAKEWLARAAGQGQLDAGYFLENMKVAAH